MTDALTYMGSLKGHGGAVTSLATPQDPKSEILLSSSRDKTVLVWKLEPSAMEEGGQGYPMKSLKGHSHFVQDVVLSSDG